MKKLLVILIAVIGLNISANAQKKIAFYNGNEHIVMYSDGTVGYWDGNKNWNGRWSGGKPYVYNNFGVTGCRTDDISIFLLDSNGKRIEWNNVSISGFNTYVWELQFVSGNQVYMYLNHKRFVHR